jgi:acyl-coenzyme A synthetase/AMP-(fatty) acid ligase
MRIDHYLAKRSANYEPLTPIILLRGTADATIRRALIAHSRARLAGFKLPEKFVFQSLPKTATGKTRKDELRTLAAPGPTDSASSQKIEALQ